MYSRIPKCPEKNCPAHLGCGRCAPLAHGRSEEHTSELQSQSNLVCRLLLEKKKKDHEREELGAGDSVVARWIVYSYRLDMLPGLDVHVVAHLYLAADCGL